MRRIINIVFTSCSYSFMLDMLKQLMIISYSKKNSTL